MGQTYSFPKQCNVAKLDAEIRAQLGPKLDGVRGHNLGTSVDLTDAALPADVTAATNLVNAHDPTPIPDALSVAVTQAITDEGASPIEGITVAAADAWITANVTDLASAKVALRQLVKVVGRLRFEVNRLNAKNGF